MPKRTIPSQIHPYLKDEKAYETKAKSLSGYDVAKYLAESDVVRRYSQNVPGYKKGRGLDPFLPHIEQQYTQRVEDNPYLRNIYYNEGLELFDEARRQEQPTIPTDTALRHFLNAMGGRSLPARTALTHPPGELPPAFVETVEGAFPAYNGDVSGLANVLATQPRRTGPLAEVIASGTPEQRRSTQQAEKQFYKEHPQDTLELTATEWTSPFGMPIYIDQHGEKHSESSTTIQLDPTDPNSKWVTVPSIWPDPETGKGRYWNDDQVRDKILETNLVNPVSGEQIQTFDTSDQAVQYAIDRDLMLRDSKHPWNQ